MSTLTSAGDANLIQRAEIDKRLKPPPPRCPHCGFTEFMEPALERDHHTHICSNCCVHSSPLGPKVRT